MVVRLTQPVFGFADDQCAGFSTSHIKEPSIGMWEFIPLPIGKSRSYTNHFFLFFKREHVVDYLPHTRPDEENPSFRWFYLSPRYNPYGKCRTTILVFMAKFMAVNRNFKHVKVVLHKAFICKYERNLAGH